MTTEELVKMFGYYREHPVDFVRTWLKAEPHPHQAEALEAVASGNRRVSIRSGRRVGKTSLMAWLSIWFNMTRTDAKVVVTAPSSAQLQDAFTPEMRKWLGSLPDGFKDLWTMQAERFVYRVGGFENLVTIRTARKDSPESLQGINATNVMVLPDEAAGVDDVVMESLSGSLGTDTAVMVLTGNPNRNTGYFHATHTTLADSWYTMHVNSEDVPSVSRDWIQEMRDKYGRHSNAYRIHVLGEFPTSSDKQIIPRDLVVAATTREVELYASEPMVWAVDVARFGDDETVLTKRRGNHVFPQMIWRNADLMQTSMKIKSEWDVSQGDQRPEVVLVDVIGMGGGVVDRLRELGIPVRGVNITETPPSTEMYRMLKDELWDRTRAWLERRDVVIPNDPKLIEQLVGAEKDYTPNGKMYVVGKKDPRMNRAKSPDRADSLILTFADVAAKAMYGKRYFKGALKRRIRGIV